MSILESITFGAPLVDALHNAGVGVKMVDDFDKVQSLEVKLSSKAPHPMLSLARNDFVNDQAFWLFLFREDQPIASLAAKFFDLSNETLESYLRRTSRNQYDRSTDPILEVDPMVGLLRGRMVYVGNLNVVDTEQGNIKVLSRYARLMQLICIAKWRFDWMYGFVSEDHVKLNRLYQFGMTVHDAISWERPSPDGRLDSHALLASSRRQLTSLFRRQTY
ncbi:MAG: hypothetical protein AAF755_10205 [Pseudomonadota bacterium]